jgi:minor extracellular protease Epr
MRSRTGKSVYIIALLAAATLALLPAGRNVAQAQIALPGVPGNLTRLPAPELDRRVKRTTEETAAKTDSAAKKAGDTVDKGADEATDTVGAAASGVQQTVRDAAAAAGGLLRAFVPATDPAGAEIERDVVVVLAEPDEVAGLPIPAEQLLARRELPGLGLTLLTLRRPAGVTLPETVDNVRSAFPGAAVDFNHVYRYAGEFGASAAAPDGAEASGAAADDGMLRIGMVDSALASDHPALAGSHIVGRDFAVQAGDRPLTHGTAVASLIEASAGGRATIYSASVFFQLPDHEPGATAESLVAALDWLAEEQLAVVNMSLAGPGNALLEKAVAATRVRGLVVVAAVGNNGPAGPPQYPAAYDGVIGVTAVDRDYRIFAYANRGDHVDYAATGVDVRVADSRSGGFTLASGTSMASPHVAVVAAEILRAGAAGPAAMLSLLDSSAKDLGRKGFDPVFGHGLITQAPVVLSVTE